MTGNGMEFRIATTYGGAFGRLARKLGLRWNHIIIVQFRDGVPLWTYQSNLRHGVTGRQFDPYVDLAWQHEWYEPVVPLTKADRQKLLGFCLGSLGKLYALYYWPRLFLRVIKSVFVVGPARALLAPSETCVTFVNAAAESIGRSVSVYGSRGLPDDIMSSTHWKRVGDG